jgi:hypothetical protein
MSGFLPAPRPVPAAIPPLLGFTAGFVDACTALALFGLFVAQVTGSYLIAVSGDVLTLPIVAATPQKRPYYRFLWLPLVSRRFRTYTFRLLTGW